MSSDDPGCDQGDQAYPQELATVADRYRLVLELVEEPDREWIAAATQYWQLRGLDPETSEPQWAHRLKDIAARTTASANRLWIMVGLAARVVCHGHTCDGCGQPAALRARQHLTSILAGEPSSTCARCSQSYLDAVQAERDPRRTDHRRVARERQHAAATLTKARAEWRTQQYAWISDYGRRQRESQLMTDVDALPVAVEAAALAVLRHAPEADPVPAVADWPLPLTPAGDWTASLLEQCWHEGLLAVGGSSDVDAFIWEPTFAQAWEQSQRGALPVEAPSAVSLVLTQVQWQPRPWRGTEPAVSLDEHLSARLALSSLSPARRRQMIDLVEELITWETVRFFDARLANFNLPPVEPNHRPKLVDCARRIAACRPLGESYYAAGSAVYGAAATAQQVQRAPLAKMTVHAINRFESKAQEASAETALTQKPFHEMPSVPLSALTRLVFFGLLDTSPMTTSVASVEQILRAAGEPSSPGRPWLSYYLEAFSSVAERPLLIDSVLDPLKRLSSHTDQRIGAAAQQIAAVAASVAAATDDARSAGIAALAASAMLPIAMESSTSDAELLDVGEFVADYLIGALAE